MRILIDADACPVPAKEILYRASERLNVPLILVANQYMRVPTNSLIEFIQVQQGADVADDHIVEITQKGDHIITADIPLADRVIKKEGFVLDPNGNFLDKENIGQRLAMRNLMDEMRSNGVETGGPSAYDNKKKQEFARHLDQFLQKMFKG